MTPREVHKKYHVVDATEVNTKYNPEQAAALNKNLNIAAMDFITKQYDIKYNTKLHK